MKPPSTFFYFPGGFSSIRLGIDPKVAEDIVIKDSGVVVRAEAEKSKQSVQVFETVLYWRAGDSPPGNRIERAYCRRS